VYYPAGNSPDYVVYLFIEPQRHKGHKEREEREKKETCVYTVVPTRGERFIIHDILNKFSLQRRRDTE
jgi:hypothetical protein